MTSNRFRSLKRGDFRPSDAHEHTASIVTLTRRHFLQGAGATIGLFSAPAFLRGIRADGALNSEIFSLGVASGDPSAHSVVLWTRLAPDPLSGGGMPDKPVVVKWYLASDPGMANVVRRGAVLALPRNGHAVHVVVTRLPSDQWFYYRFYTLGESSRVGRTRTFPGRYDARDHMRFAVANCQDFRDGFYPAYRDMAEQDLDFVLHVGDYIYENGPRDNPIAEGRNHIDGEAVTLEDYRNRYALYRLDHNLQAAHAAFPFVVTWDDHEVDNNYAGLFPAEDSPTQGEEFIARRRAAYQAYSEMLPLRPCNRLHGRFNPRMQLSRRLRFGDLADIHVLDTRQFRTDQPAEDGLGSTDPDSLLVEAFIGETIFDPDGILNSEASMLGTRQERWLARNLRRSQATWNILAQQVMLTRWNLIEASRTTIESDPTIPYALKLLILGALANVDDIVNVDAWDGYQSARRRLFDILAWLRPNNPIVLSGDIHSAWGSNLLEDFSNPDSDMLAVEFVASSISSTFGSLDPRPTDAVVRSSVGADNPHIEYFNGLFRGYCVCDIDRSRCQTTYRAVGSPEAVIDPGELALVPFEDSPVATDAILEIAAGFNEPGSNAQLETKFARGLPIP